MALDLRLFVLVIPLGLMTSAMAQAQDQRLRTLEAVEALSDSDYLGLAGVTSEEFEKMTHEDLKKIFRKRSQLIHPDAYRDFNDPALIDRADKAFRRVSNAFDALQVAVHKGKQKVEPPSSKRTIVYQSHFPFQPHYFPRREYLYFVARNEMEREEFLNQRFKDTYDFEHWILKLLDSGPTLQHDPEAKKILDQAIKVYENKFQKTVDRDALLARLVRLDLKDSLNIGDNFGTRTPFLGIWNLLPEIAVSGGRETYQALIELQASAKAYRLKNFVSVLRDPLSRRVEDTLEVMKRRDVSLTRSSNILRAAWIFCRRMHDRIKGN